MMSLAALQRPWLSLLTVILLSVELTDAAQLAVVNRLSRPLHVTIDDDASPNETPTNVEVNANDTRVFGVGGSATSFGESTVKIDSPPFSAELFKGTQRYAVLIVAGDNDGDVSIYDTNDLQVELNSAAHSCVQTDEGGALTCDDDCMASKAFNGGLPKDFVKKAFTQLWSNLEYWHLCNKREPLKPLRRITSQAGYPVDILREEPLVATIRNFISETDCNELLTTHAKKDELVMATVGGTGNTVTSESRETLTNSLNVNWDADNILSQTAVKTFDVASELLGEEIPYEAQEPINFLHYQKGFEYKPHTDGRGYNLGDRVATTLIYCEIATDGGGTVFPRAEPLPFRYQPENPGDLIYFEYQPKPFEAEHSACPVIEGSKSTFTQWYRLGVSAEEPWYKFENWGEFHNPHLHTKWKGPRYGRKENEYTEL